MRLFYRTSRMHCRDGVMSRCRYINPRQIVFISSTRRQELRQAAIGYRNHGVSQYRANTSIHGARNYVVEIDGDLQQSSSQSLHSECRSRHRSA